MGSEWILVVALTALIEGVTCLFRFGLRMQSTRDTAWLARFTLGFRVHHGYIGLVMMFTCPFVELGVLYSTLLAGGAAMFISDLIHHFAVLWPVTGQPELHVVYPDSRWRRLQRIQR